MLNYDQAVYFLEQILGMPPTWRELLWTKPLEFLKLYMKRHAIRIPFQNMEMAAKDVDKRWFPSEEDIVNTGLSGKGGCCIYLNYFTKLVLQALGLNSFVVRGDHYCAPIAGTHCIAMVKFNGPDVYGIYMVEVGGAYPMLEPIPMESLPYKILQAGGYPYEYREFAPGWVGKFHIGGGLLAGTFTDKKESLRTSWDLKPRALWEFDYPMLETFTKPCYSALLKNPMMYRFFTTKEFQRLFPQLPENVGKVTTNQLLTKLNKTLTITEKPAKAAEKVPVNNAKNDKIAATNGNTIKTNNKVTNGKSSTDNRKPLSSTENKPNASASNGKVSAVSNAKNSSTTNGKSLNSSKLIIAEESEEEKEMVTEDVGFQEEYDDNPKKFVFAWKRTIVVGDANSRKVVKKYDTYEEMGVDLKRFFPQIPGHAVDKAMKVFVEYDNPIPTAYDSIL